MTKSEKAINLSIGLPVYNGEDFVAEAIASLLAQTRGDFELVISDNHSTDRLLVCYMVGLKRVDGVWKLAVDTCG